MSTTSRSTEADSLLTQGLPYPETFAVLRALLSEGVTTFLCGSPGIGKSALARDLAQEMALPLYDIRLAQCEPAEIAGVHFPDRKTGTLRVYPPAWLPALCDGPGFLFLDELNAPGLTRLHQATALQLTLDRRLGDLALHPKTVILAAGNSADDHAYVTPLSRALSNRFAHVRLRVDADAWLQWGSANHICPQILAFIGQAGADSLYRNDGNDAFPSPRTWAMASRMLATKEEPKDARTLLAACIGPRATEEFLSFLQIYERIDPVKVIEKGKRVDFTTRKRREPSFVYASVFAVADWICRQDSLDASSLEHIVRFISSPGLHEEMQFLFLRQLYAQTDLIDRLKSLESYRELSQDMVRVYLELYR